MLVYEIKWVSKSFPSATTRPCPAASLHQKVSRTTLQQPQGRATGDLLKQTKGPKHRKQIQMCLRESKAGPESKLSNKRRRPEEHEAPHAQKFLKACGQHCHTDSLRCRKINSLRTRQASYGLEFAKRSGCFDAHFKLQEVPNIIIHTYKWCNIGA